MNYLWDDLLEIFSVLVHFSHFVRNLWRASNFQFRILKLVCLTNTHMHLTFYCSDMDPQYAKRVRNFANCFIKLDSDSFVIFCSNIFLRMNLKMCLECVGMISIVWLSGNEMIWSLVWVFINADALISYTTFIQLWLISFA